MLAAISFINSLLLVCREGIGASYRHIDAHILFPEAYCPYFLIGQFSSSCVFASLGSALFCNIFF